MVGASGVVQTRDASRSHSNRRFAGSDLSLGEQLRQRAAMGVEKERAELAESADFRAEFCLGS
jgi:hypothetical protein